MKAMTNTILATTALACHVGRGAGHVHRPHAVDLTVVSWGGAYTASQLEGLSRPLHEDANPDVKIINEDYSGEGLAKLRAQTEAGNVTWDLVDMVAVGRHHRL